MLENDQIERFVKLQIGILAVSAMRLQIINLGKHPAETSNIDRLSFQLAFGHEQCEQRKYFLSASEGECGNQHGAFSFKHAPNGCAQALDFRFTRKLRRQLTISACRFHYQHVRFYIFEARFTQEGLIMETNVTSIEKRFLLATHTDTGRTQRMAGIIKLQAGR